MLGTVHLDLGCGDKPRNPYGFDNLFGLDIRVGENPNIRKCNLSAESIPFEDSFFDAVSAYDFLEHVPRVIVDISNAATNFPFINLMNEVHRVLKSGGKFYASTPAFPSQAVFADPTHVNFITRGTHQYFVGDNPMGRMYGFNGNFKLVRAKFYLPRVDYHPNEISPRLLFKQVKDILKMRRSHMLWEFQKI